MAESHCAGILRQQVLVEHSPIGRAIGALQVFVRGNAHRAGFRAFYIHKLNGCCKANVSRVSDGILPRSTLPHHLDHPASRSAGHCGDPPITCPLLFVRDPPARLTSAVMTSIARPFTCTETTSKVSRVFPLDFPDC